MTDQSHSPYKPMYKVRPYFVVRKVKLPDCMYLVQPIHKLPALTTDEGDYQRALDSLEERQEKIFARIRELQEAVVKAGRDVGLSAEEIQCLTENYVPDGTPLDVVVTTPPNTAPYPILALYQYIKKNVPTCLKSFVHSTATGRVDPQLINRFTSCDDSATNRPPRLKITVIWKEIEEVTMIYAPGRQIPVSGLSNICRFLSRQFCPQLYESLSPLVAGQSDSWLDLLSLSYVHGNSKEKASVIRQMNSALGSKAYLTGECPTLADVVLYSFLVGEKGLKLTANVKNWMKKCHGHPELNSIPSLYLDNLN